VDAAITVAIISAAGIIGSTAIQAWNTRSANRRADEARQDERGDAEKRRKEDREDAARQREEDRAAALATQEAERVAAKKQAERERLVRELEYRRSGARDFIAQAEKCYGLMQLVHFNPHLQTGHHDAVSMDDWKELSRVLGDVVLNLPNVESLKARAFVEALQRATVAGQYNAAMPAAAEALQEFADMVRQDLAHEYQAEPEDPDDGPLPTIVSPSS
jgi:HAMP domain-containing protein